MLEIGTSITDSSSLRNLRTQLNLTLKKIARDTNISSSLLYKIESGERTLTDDVRNKLNIYFASKNYLNQDDFKFKLKKDLKEYGPEKEVILELIPQKNHTRTCFIKDYQILSNQTGNHCFITTLGTLKDIFY